MKKINFILLVLFLNIFSFVGCSSRHENTELAISIEDKEIPYIVEESDDYEEEKEKQLIKDFIKNEDIPYIKIGETISIQFGKKYPEQIVFKDYLLNQDGSRKFPDNLTMETQLLLDDSTLKYELASHKAVSLSSDSNDYLDGNVVRGISFVYNRDGKEYKYTFVIKTDIE